MNFRRQKQDTGMTQLIGSPKADSNTQVYSPLAGYTLHCPRRSGAYLQLR